MRHEGVAKRVHRQIRRHSRHIAEIIGEFTFGEAGARSRFDRYDLNVGSLDFSLHEGKSEAREVGSPADTGDYC